MKSDGAPRSPAPSPPRQKNDPGRKPSIAKRVAWGTLAIAVLGLDLAVDRTLAHPWGGVAMVCLFALQSCREYHAMLADSGRKVRARIGLLACAALYAAKIVVLVQAGAAASVELVGWSALLYLFVLLALEVIDGDPASGLDRTAHGLLGFVYLAGFSFSLDLLLLPPAPRGILMAMYVVLVSKNNDIGGYLVGSLAGGRKLAPRVSPGKTWWGALGGLAFCVAAAFIGRYSLELSITAVETLVFALAVGVATQCGDLAESLMKRACNTKDSARLLPTFGGALDMIDSLVFAAPLGAWILQRAGSLGGA